MVQRAIAAGGAFLGSAIGVGASLGWAVGAFAGQLLFPPDPIKSEGARLGNLSVTSSAYGRSQGIGYGTVRMGGNIIWSSGIG